MKIVVALSILSLIVLALAGCGGAGQASLTPDQIVTAFQEAGLEAAQPVAMTADDYGMAPYVAKGVHFVIPSLCEDCGGRAFVGTRDEIEQLAKFYEEAGQASALLFSWTFKTPGGRGLVQINGDLPEADALRYKAVMEAIGQ